MLWPRTDLCDLLGIEHPILQAPMAGSTTPALVAAVSNAGGLGGHGCATLSLDAFKDHVHQIRAASNRPFHVNFFNHDAPPKDGEAGPLMRAALQGLWDEAGLDTVPAATNPWPLFTEESLAAVLEMRPHVVSFHFGLPRPAIVDAIKGAGCVLICSATSVAEAHELERRGVDAIIAQGFEAGGHRGTFLGDVMAGTVPTMVLVPQIVSAVSVPVIAAGGIMDGRGIAAALALGASGVQIGTAFLTCPEAAVSAIHHATLMAAAGNEVRTLVTKGVSGRPARGIANRLLKELVSLEGQAAPFPMQNTLTRPLSATGEAEFAVMWAGAGAAGSRGLAAAELMGQLVSETEAALAALRT
jgi:nitronate monooxygenase